MLKCWHMTIRVLNVFKDNESKTQNALFWFIDLLYSYNGWGYLIHKFCICPS